jgi:hypothetical protein
MKTRKSPRWYYEGRAILVVVAIVVLISLVGYMVISCVSDNISSFN